MEYGKNAQNSVLQLVAQRRVSGSYPPALLARVRVYYKTLFTYGHAITRPNFIDEIVNLGSHARVDIDVVTQTPNRILTTVKRLLRNAFAWYFNYVVHQFNNFADKITNVVLVLDTRVKQVESQFNKSETEAFVSSTHPPPPQLILAVEHLIQTTVSKAQGRTLISQQNGIEVLAAFRNSSSPAYGLTSHTSYLASADGDLDLRHETLTEHIANVAKDSLGAIVLADVPRPVDASALFNILEKINRALITNGILCLFLNELNQDDLKNIAGGSSLTISIPTWKAILARYGFTNLTIKRTEESDFVAIVGTLSNKSKGTDD